MISQLRNNTAQLREREREREREMKNKQKKIGQTFLVLSLTRKVFCYDLQLTDLWNTCY